jgi:hypothetical protein
MKNNTRSKAVTMPPKDIESTIKKHVKGSVTIEALTAVMKEQSTMFESLFNGLSAKLDGFQNGMMKRMELAEQKIGEIEEKLATHVKNFETKIDLAIKDLQRRAKLSQDLHVINVLKLNSREQRNRAHSAKVSFYLDLSIKSAPSARDVYTRLIRPALEDAKLAGRLEWLPEEYGRIIEVGHILPGRKGLSPSFQFSFISRAALHAFLDFKRPYINALNLQNEKMEPSLLQAVVNGTRRKCKAGADLTAMNRDLMTWLMCQKGVSAVKLAGTRVMYARTGVKGWYHASNPFGKNLAEVSALQIDTSSVLRNLFIQPVPPFLRTDAKDRNLLFDDVAEDLILANEEARQMKEAVTKSGMVVPRVEQLSGGEVVASGVVVSGEVAVDNPSGAAAGSKSAGVPGEEDEVAEGAPPSGDVEEVAQEEVEAEDAAQGVEDVQASADEVPAVISG